MREIKSRVQTEQPEERINTVRNGKRSRIKSSDIFKVLMPKLKVFLVSFLIVAVVFGSGIAITYNQLFAPVDSGDTTEIEVVIPRGSSLSQISQILYDSGIVRNKTVFKYYTDFSDMSSKLQAGTYKLTKAMSLDDIITELQKGTGGDPVVRYTIVEGLTFDGLTNAVTKEHINGILDVMVEKGVVTDKEAFLELCKTGENYDDYWFIAEAIAENEKDGGNREYVLEGYLFPDTYEVYVGSSNSTIIRKHLDRFDEIFTDDYRKRAQEIGMTVDEVVTLASLIEREGKAQDFKKISAVFHNRLDRNMALGSCATLQYIHKVNKYVFNSQERNVDSPYNTYKYAGLPAGPICNPGKSAIEAALYPDESFVKEGYLYFCLGDASTGETVFAKTLEEHNANVEKYQSTWN